VKITAAERDALYDQIHARLSGIDEVWMAAEVEDWERAGKVGREFSDDLRLILDDLGWGEGSGEPLELTSPPDVLRRVFTRLRIGAEERRAVEEEERAESSLSEEGTARLLEACRRVLGDLENGGE